MPRVYVAEARRWPAVALVVVVAGTVVVVVAASVVVVVVAGARAMVICTTLPISHRLARRRALVDAEPGL